MLMTEPSVASSAGEVVPQYGHTSACLAGVQTASAPHAGQRCLSSAEISGTERG